MLGRSRRAPWSCCSSSGSTGSASPRCQQRSSQSGSSLGRRRGTRTSSTWTTSACPATSSTGTRRSGCTSRPTLAPSPTCWVRSNCDDSSADFLSVIPPVFGIPCMSCTLPCTDECNKPLSSLFSSSGSEPLMRYCFRKKYIKPIQVLKQHLKASLIVSSPRESGRPFQAFDWFRVWLPFPLGPGYEEAGGALQVSQGETHLSQLALWGQAVCLLPLRRLSGHLQHTRGPREMGKAGRQIVNNYCWKTKPAYSTLARCGLTKVRRLKASLCPQLIRCSKADNFFSSCLTFYWQCAHSKQNMLFQSSTAQLTRWNGLWAGMGNIFSYLVAASLRLSLVILQPSFLTQVIIRYPFSILPPACSSHYPSILNWWSFSTFLLNSISRHHLRSIFSNQFPVSSLSQLQLLPPQDITGAQPSMTVQQGKHTTVLEMEFCVLDFCLVTDSVYRSDYADPESVLVLLTNDLVRRERVRAY